MALTNIFARQVKPSGKAAGDKYADGQGLYLLVKPSGKYWRFDYRHADKRRTLAIGVYPAVTLAAARKKRDAARALLEDGIDPMTAKRAEKAAALVAAENTFEAIAREFHATKGGGWSATYSTRWMERMEKNLFPYIRRLPLLDVTAPVLLGALRRVESRGAVDTAHRLRQMAGPVLRYGIQTGRGERDSAADLVGALKPAVTQHMAAILDPAKVGELLRAIDGYSGQPVTRAALQLSALLFQRPGNIRRLEWGWVDTAAAMLAIPASAMKRRLYDKINGAPHWVPLAPQAVAIFEDVRPLTGHLRYVFPSARGRGRPMSENTVNAALRRLGFTSNDMTAHGFRAMARTLIAERIPGVGEGVIEAQLAHAKAGPLGAAYDRAEFMAQRVAMMRAWADYLDKLRVGAEVIQLREA